MSELNDQLEAARAEVARLERLVSVAPCIEVGHKWKHIGGCNAGCHDDLCCCSIPVHVCEACGDCDYGQNAEAAQVRADCWDRYGDPETRF